MAAIRLSCLQEERGEEEKEKEKEEEKETEEKEPEEKKEEEAEEGEDKISSKNGSVKLGWACIIDLHGGGGKLSEAGEGETIMHFMKYIYICIWK